MLLAAEFQIKYKQFNSMQINNNNAAISLECAALSVNKSTYHGH